MKYIYIIVLIIFYSCINRDKEIEGIYVSVALQDFADSRDIDYCILLNKSLHFHKGRIKEFSLLCFDGVGSYDHGGVLIDLIAKIGQDKFIEELSNTTQNERLLIRTTLEGGLEYHHNPIYHEIKLNVIYPKVFNFLSKIEIVK